MGVSDGVEQSGAIMTGALAQWIWDDNCVGNREEGMMNGLKRFPSSIACVLTVSSFAGAMGCAKQQATSFDSGVHAEQTALNIRNNHWQDVRVYLVTSSGTVSARLGTVSAASSARIPVAGQLLHEIRTRGSLRIQLRPLGSRSSYTTEDVIVRPGDEVRLSVANQLRLTTVHVMRP